MISKVDNIENIDQKRVPDIQAEHKKDEPIRDKSEISNTSKVFNKLDNFMNLGKSDRLNVGDLNGPERKEFLKMLSNLLKKGFAGYEVLDVNHHPEKHFIETEIGDERIYGAKLYKKRGYNK